MKLELLTTQKWMEVDLMAETYAILMIEACVDVNEEKRIRSWLNKKVIKVEKKNFVNEKDEEEEES